MKNEIKSKKFIVGIIIAVLMVSFNIFNFSVYTNAAAANFSNSVEKTQLFAVPNGGWSTVTAKVEYIEEYAPAGGADITLKKRWRSVLWRREYATSCPTIQILNIKHSNGKVFSSFTREQTIYGAPWQGSSSEVNTQSVTISRIGGITGNLPFILACEGGVPSSSTGSVSLAFK